MSAKRLLIMSSGGDAPGMNAAIRALVRSGLYYNLEIFGAHLGYQGIIENDILPLDEKSVGNIIQRGGTILKSARYPAFKEAAVRKQAIEILKQRQIDSLIVLGGDGSFRGASLLADETQGQLRVLGIPCTIDNDIRGTEYTIGFDTACNTALDAIDRIRDTAFSHNRHFLVEVMGRNTGFLAVEVGLAGGAECILIPEIPLDMPVFIKNIQLRRLPKMGSIIVVAEGKEPGRSLQIANELQANLAQEYKVCILGHTQRGGSPSVKDRKIAGLMGAKAIELLLEGESHKMLAIQQGAIVAVPFPDPSLGPRQFEDLSLVKINDILCGMK